MGQLYYLVATAIVVKGDKYLIAKRSEKEDKFPGKWTVPGGKIEKEDHTEANEAGVCYEVIEEAVKREVLEEVGVKVNNMRYLISMVYPKKEVFACCLSFFADYDSGDVVLDPELVEYAWVSVEEMPKYDLIPGIPEEILMVDDVLKGVSLGRWKSYVDRYANLKRDVPL